MSILSVLFIGVFVANIDMTFMLATYSQISSELHAFQYGSWLLTAYMLAMCASQPLYGKLSNIFGKKKLLIITYLLYATGSAICAMAQNIRQVIVGRIVGGTGGAGMVCLVSIIITDIVPLREVAVYRSYVNVVQTIGRSVGAPLGGLIVEKLGWRVAFIVITPLSLSGALLVAWRLKIDENPNKDAKQTQKSNWELMKRIDFLGSLLLSLTIISLLLIFSLGGGQLAWNDARISALMGGTVLFGVLFYVTETYWAAEPIFPPSILTIRAVATSYGLLFLQNAAQSAASLSIPLFFQILLSVGPSTAGTYLMPSVLGNAIGGLATGIYVKSHGRYKMLCILSAVSSALSYILMYCRWGTQPGFMPVLEDFYVVGAGLGTGMAHAAGFVVLTAGVSARVIEDGGNEVDVQENIAIAGSGIYLFGNIGATMGVSISSAVLQWLLKHSLTQHLSGNQLEEVTRKALESIEWVQTLDKGSVLREIVVEAYMDGIHGTFFMAAMCSIVGIAVSLLVIEHKFT